MYITSIALLALTSLLTSSLTLADVIQPIKQTPRSGSTALHKDQNNKVEYRSQEEEGSEDQFFPRIESVFGNPTILANLERGADVINRSIESLMDSVFYSLLDNEYTFKINEFSWISLNLSRKVFTTSRGAYVVVDRFSYGPQSFKILRKISQIPLQYGRRGGLDILDIYLRTDAQRLAEIENQSWPTYLANTWGGLLPVLARILPPSFNSNELYNPLRQVQNPFTFPLSKESLMAMQIGSVRSFGITGGISLPLDFGVKISQHYRNIIEKSGVVFQLPYGVFIEGEFRINILRRTENIVWVGLTKKREVGHTLNPLLGGVYYILKNALGGSIPWAGLAAPVTPIKVVLKDSLLSVFNQLYEFDLRNKNSRKAYWKAVKGDFILASKLAKKKQGVVFHFNRDVDANVSEQNYSNNLFAMRDDRNKQLKTSDISIWSPKGKSFVLESEALISTRYWNLLSGPSSSELSTTLEIPVNKQEIAGKTIYSFQKKNSPSYTLRFRLQINDRNADSLDYLNYLKDLRLVSNLPLHGLPDIPRKNESTQLRKMNESFFSSPDRSAFVFHPPDQRVGKMDAQAIAIIKKKHFDQLLKQKPEQWWHTLLALFDKRLDFKRSYEFYEDPLLLATLSSTLTLPAHIIARYNLWDIHLDEIQGIISSLKSLKTKKTPVEIRDGFHQLLKTNHPRKLLQMIFMTSHAKSIRRKASIFVNPNKNLPAHIVKQLKKTNTSSFLSHKTFPQPEGHRIAQDKLNAFIPGHLSDRRIRPAVSHLAISAKRLSRFDLEKQIQVEIYASGLPASAPVKVYVRLEQSGMLLLGKYVLGQDVINLTPSIPPTSTMKQKINMSYFSFYLTGPKSPLSDFIYDRAIKIGGEFLLSIAVSTTGRIWSQEKTFKFIFDAGNLKPPEKS